MATSPDAVSTWSFGPFRLEVAQSRLTRDGSPVVLRPKAFDVLAALVVRADRLVTKDELLDAVWGRRFITEGVIKSVVGELRTALDDDPRQPRWIETVPRRGYRFVGSLSAGIDTAPAAATAEPSEAAASLVANGAAAEPIVVGNIPHNVPRPVGRDDALTAVSALHDAHRLVTVCGPSGVGKTRLALALGMARRTAWRDGVWFVELASLDGDTTDVTALCAAIVQLLRLDAKASTDPALLATALRPLEMLLVLDNCEHVVGAVSRLVAALLAGTTTLRIVATSQEPLRLADEQVWRLAPLRLPVVADDAHADRLMTSSAVQLFVQRVSTRVQGFALTPEQQQAVAAICRALDGLPLALELAAARVPLLGVHGVAELLADDAHGARLQLLTAGARDAVPRQRTLRNAIEWSHRLLDDTQQIVFRRLGVFEGAFSLAAAQSVCHDDTLDAWAVLDALDALVDKSLVDATHGPTGVRFRLLQSLATFARERLVEAGDDAATRDRHLDAIRDDWALAGDRALREPSEPWFAAQLPGLDDLRAALRWAQQRDCGPALVTLAADSTWLWFRACLPAEGRAWCERARPYAVDDGPLRDRFDLTVAMLAVYTLVYPWQDALAGAQRAADGFERAGDDLRAYFAVYCVFQLQVRGQVAFDRTAVLDRMSRLARPDWNDVTRRFLRGARGYDRRLAGDADGYRSFCRSELALCRALGAQAEAWVAAQGLMLSEQDIGHADEAIEVGRIALDEIRAAGRLRQQGVFLALWTTMVAEQGPPDRARTALGEALPVLRGIDGAWMADVALAWLAAHEGRDDDACRLLGWHAASLASGRAQSAGAYIARSLASLTDRLQRRLSPAIFEARIADGRALDAGAVERVAFGR